MIEQIKSDSADELNRLLAQFHAIKNHDEQCRFYHANPSLHSVIRGILFPKPADKPVTKL